MTLFLSLTFMHVDSQQVVLAASFLGYVLQLAEFLNFFQKSSPAELSAHFFFVLLH